MKQKTRFFQKEKRDNFDYLRLDTECICITDAHAIEHVYLVRFGVIVDLVNM